MGSFDRSARRRVQFQWPPRIQRLDRELMKEGTKQFDYVYAVGQGLRIKVCVMRDIDHKFYATAQIGNRAFRQQSGCPSGAYFMLSVAMKVYLANLTEAKREEIRRRNVQI